jgi:putative FmdB family regulatory protein
MPLYDYSCESCSKEFDLLLSVSERGLPQSCPDCGSPARKILSKPNFNLPGDDWPSKNLRIKQQMAEKNRRLASREKELKQSGGVPKLVPNVDGERVGSWSEAKKLAASKGKDTGSYEPMIRKEKTSGA